MRRIQPDGLRRNFAAVGLGRTGMPWGYDGLVVDDPRLLAGHGPTAPLSERGNR